ncbi:MAG TPA: PhoH family protein, partial [Bacteroidales bacterium]|nr:PhoH family protein [Bacteroidales bacterium]
SQTIAKLYQTPEVLSSKDIRLKKPHSNQYYILRNKDGLALARYDSGKKRLLPVPNHKAYGISPRNVEQNFALDALLNPSVSLVSLTGIAGTGKTLLALAAALAQEDDYDQIMLSRPVIPLKNQEMGFLPGDIKEKLAPYMLPLMDNLNVIKGNLKPNSREYIRIEEMLKNEKLLISPLAYIRGRSLSKVFFIVDESQNLTPHEVKTIITRAGEGSKLVFTGDIYQIDQPYLDMHSNGLTYLTDKMLGQNLFAHVNLVKGERSRLAELAGNIL